MTDGQDMTEITAIRGAALTFSGDPFLAPLDSCMTYESDAIVLMQGGKITEFGPANGLQAKVPANVKVTRYTDGLILPGFVDCHVHYPQTQIIGAYGEQLLDWLEKYAFPAEISFSDADHAREVAEIFIDETLRAGTTTAAVYCTVHPQSVDAFFEQAAQRNLRMIAGKILMDRNAPDALTDTATQGYDESKALIEKWHGRGRALYAITPRFAPTSTHEQMEATAALWREFPDTYLQTHVSENRDEVAWVADLFPGHKNYLDVYDKYDMLGERAVHAHAVHFSEEEFNRCHQTGTAIAHCPTSNLFVGSGLFDMETALDPSRPVRVGLATDVGGGTSLSMLQTMNEAYKVAQLNGYSLSAGHAFYLATRGGAAALYLEDRIGSIAPGMEADLVVLDLKSTPLIEFRMRYAEDILESLFVQMIMGDDRATRATYVAGGLAYDRAADTGMGR